MQVLGVTSKELIPKGTRFGPLVGESYTNEILLTGADRKYFWRVSEFACESLDFVFLHVKFTALCFKTVHILYLHLEMLLWLWCGRS